MNNKTQLMFINGEWQASASGDTIPAINPYSRETWAYIQRGNAEDANKAVAAADTAFQNGWGDTTGYQRAAYLRNIGELITQAADDLARVESTDNGKPIRETGAQVKAAGKCFTYFAGLADKIFGQVIPLERKAIFDFTQRRPYGVIVAITAWNSPLAFFATKVAPALAAGNTVVLKPSEIASMSTLELVKAIEEAGLPPGVLNVVTGYGREIGAALVGDTRVRKVSVTGGATTGKVIGRELADRLCPAVFELGGKSANIIFEDAEFEEAIGGAIAGIFAAGGQTCIAGSRLLVQESIYTKTIDALVERIKRIRLGDPLEPSTEMGPLASSDQVENMKAFVQAGLEDGATLLTGGKQPPELPGFFFEPTVFTDVRNDMCVARQEAFGPVLSVIPFKDDAEAIAIANDSEFGLAAGVWTSSIRRAFKVLNALDVGTVWVNTYRVSTFAAPFGGVKSSGYGREKGTEAINEFTTLKNVMIDVGEGIGDPFAMRT
jgi:acyl-CoA reductase-like NAD-dependent aldehyde dehydrogenase